MVDGFFPGRSHCFWPVALFWYIPFPAFSQPKGSSPASAAEALVELVAPVGLAACKSIRLGPRADRASVERLYSRPLSTPVGVEGGLTYDEGTYPVSPVASCSTRDAQAKIRGARRSIVVTTLFCGTAAANIVYEAVLHGDFWPEITVHLSSLIPFSIGLVTAPACLLFLPGMKLYTILRGVLRWYPCLIAVKGVIAHGDRMSISERKDISADPDMYIRNFCWLIILSAAVHALLQVRFAEMALFLVFSTSYVTLLSHQAYMITFYHLCEVAGISLLTLVAYGVACWKHAKETHAPLAAAQELTMFAAVRPHAGAPKRTIRIAV